jgi:probable rRNA maturation factor
MLTKPTPQVTDLVNFVKRELGIAEATAVDVTFVDEDVMAELHMRYMGLPGPTDVFSFPATDVANGPVDPKNLQGQPMLGDIVICPDFIASNTHSEPTQMNIDACVIHAMLHLIGHDHGDAPSRAVMKNQETKLATHWRTAATHEAAQSAKA